MLDFAYLVLVSSVCISVRLEVWVSNEHVIGAKLQKVIIRLALRLIFQHREVAVVKFKPILGPALAALCTWSIFGVQGCLFPVGTAAVGVRAANSVPTAERNDVLVVQAHAVEHTADVSGVVLVVGCRVERRLAVSLVVGRVALRQAAFNRHLAVGFSISAAEAQRDPRATSSLNTSSRRHLDEVCPANVRILLLDRFKQAKGVVKASVGAVPQLLVKADGAFGAAGVRVHIVVATVVPRQPDL